MDEDPLHCPVARACGGCALIERPYAEQRQIKTERVKAAFAAWPSLAGAPVERCRAAPSRVRYRNRGKLAVRQTTNGVRIGLHRRGTNEIVDLAPCRVQRPAVQRGIEPLRRWLDRYSLAHPAGPVFYVDLRESVAGRCHLTLVLDRDVELAGPALDRLLDGWEGLDGIAVNLGSPASSYPMGAESRPLRGRATLLAALGSERGELRFEVPCGGFFQVASSSLAPIHEAMRTHLGLAECLHDLYCGVGVHGIAVAAGTPGPRSLCGIESSAPLVRAARRNADRHGIHNALYVAGRVESELPAMLEARPPHGVILNPGRSGCGEGVVRLLAAGAMSRLAYLSCNPATLARDLSGLDAGGWRLTLVRPYDLMPHTDHVEVLALLER